MKKNADLEVILGEIDRWDVEVLRDAASGGKHKYVEILLRNGARHKLHYSTSPREIGPFRPYNVRSTVRQKMRLFGVELKAACVKAKAVIPVRSVPPVVTTKPIPISAPVRVPPPPAVEQPTIDLTQKQETTTVATEEKKTRKQVQLSFAQVGMIALLVRENSVINDGKRSYAAGWNDDRITKLVNAAHPERLPARVDHIVRVRNESFKDWVELKKAKLGRRSFTEMLKRIEDRQIAIEARLTAIEDATTRPNQPDANATNGQHQPSVSGSWPRHA